ncbi:MAG TPA: hypothetical protein VG867_03000 [Rhizomicrobium sp.]|nr:hypothetical protein [Rhizomicrobium sp.]
METYAPLLAVTIVFSIAILGLLKTKKPGWGPYTMSLLLLTLVVFTAAVAFSLGRIDWPSASGLLLAVAGYAGGLLTSQQPEKDDSKS